MPQVLKDEVRDRILKAALEVFAAQGFIGATMAMIGERAGLGTASLYRYYKSKDALFDAVIPQSMADRFESLLERRVRALGRGDPDDRGGEMLRFWIDHRLAVVVLLDRAAGTRHGHYGERFVEHLVEGTIAQLPGVKLEPAQQFVLRRIFENTRTMLASILATHEDERSIRKAIEAFWAYQIAGLRGFSEHVQR